MSRISSARQPGISVKRAGVQRALGSTGTAVIAGTGCVGVGGLVGGTTVAVTGDDVAGVATGGTVPQPASAITNAIKIGNQNDAATRDRRDMIESGMWIFLVEAVAAGCLFVGLIWWVVRGTGDRDRKRREFDEKARKDAEAAANSIGKS